MFLSAQTPLTATAGMVQNMQAGAHDEEIIRGGTSVTGKVLINKISVGLTAYELVRPIQVNHSWEELWFCWAQEFGFNYVGQAETLSKAYDNWQELVHADFQKLYRKRSFEMTDTERERWKLLVAVIDVFNYKQTTPLSLREIGCVSYGKKAYPTRIKWINGSYDIISLSQVPPELAECQPSQWIEAIVKRDPIMNRLITIDHIEKISSLRIPSLEKLQENWESLPKAELPQSEWGWPDSV